MTSCLVSHVRLATDNLFSVTLFTDGVPWTQPQMVAITRAVLEIDDGNGTTVDTDVTPGILTWDTLVTDEGVDTYPIQGVGADFGIPAGTYMDCRLRIHSPAWPDGLEWPQPLSLVIDP